jgi:hypothetical protein
MNRYLIRIDLNSESDPNGFSGPYPRYWRSLRRRDCNSTEHRGKGQRYDKRQTDAELGYLPGTWWYGPDYLVSVEES